MILAARSERGELARLIDEGNERYFTSEANTLIRSYRESIEKLAVGLFEDLGLDPRKIGISPGTFLENLIRREQAYVTLGDKTQAGLAWLASRVGYVNDNGSIGPLQINPGAYRGARKANGL